MKLYLIIVGSMVLGGLILYMDVWLAENEYYARAIDAVKRRFKR